MRVADDGPGVVHPVSPSGASSVETAGSPKFLGNPNSRLPMLSDPGRLTRPRPQQDDRMAPAKGTTKAPTTRDFRGSIAWLSGWPPTYHDAGCPSPRKARFQVLVRLSWTGFYPQGSCERFSTHFMFVVLPSQASWHNPGFSPRGDGRGFTSPLLSQSPTLRPIRVRVPPTSNRKAGPRRACPRGRLTNPHRVAASGPRPSAGCPE